MSITINKEQLHSSDQGVCYSAYITYNQPHEAAIAILAVDQKVRDSRLIRASFGRTKYCKFFLRQMSACPNRDCPYMHTLCTNAAEIVNENQNQNESFKKEFFKQCQRLAFMLSKISEVNEEEFRAQIAAFRENNYSGISLR